MSSFSDYLEEAVLNHVFRNSALSAPASVHLALYTVAPTDAGGGTQMTGTGYARQAITFGAPSAGAISNTAAVTFTAGGAWSAAVAVGVFDASSAGNLLSWQTITSATLGNGDSLTFAIGDLDITLT